MFSFHGVGGKYHGNRYLRTSNGGSSLVGDVELASSCMKVGATMQEKFIVLHFRVKSKV
jgi:hypothetical protein